MNKKRNQNNYWPELKNLWNQFDPIGVYGEDSNWPDDEYESYIEPTFALLTRDADFNELHTYIHFIVTKHMGMEQLKNTYIANFVRTLQTWYILYKAQ